MFTGLIEDIATVAEKIHKGTRTVLIVQSTLTGVACGDSIAVNGACLTIENIDKAAGQLHFHLLDETLTKTTLGEAEVGARLNLELAVRAGDRMGGD